MPSATTRQRGQSARRSSWATPRTLRRLSRCHTHTHTQNTNTFAFISHEISCCFRFFSNYSWRQLSETLESLIWIILILKMNVYKFFCFFDISLYGTRTRWTKIWIFCLHSDNNKREMFNAPEGLNQVILEGVFDWKNDIFWAKFFSKFSEEIVLGKPMFNGK